MATDLNTISFEDFVSLETINFLKGADSVIKPMLSSGLVEERMVPNGQGNTIKFTEIDDNEYLSYKGQNDAADAAQFVQGYSKTLTTYRFANNIEVSYEWITQNKYSDVTNKFLNAGRKGANRMDLDLSHRIGFGTATSMTDMDGRTIDLTTGDSLQLFYSAHTLTGSSLTYRNRVANNPALSKGALEAMQRLANEQTYNNLGEALSLNYDILFTTNDANAVNTAKEYLNSTASLDANNSGVVNVYNGNFKHVILPRMQMTAAAVMDSDKRGYWGLASSMQKPIKIGVYESAHLINPTIDSDTDARKMGARIGYGVCTPSARGILFSSGDGE